VSLRWRRNRRLVIALVAFVVLLAVLFGASRVSAITSGGSAAADPVGSIDIPGTVDVFDDRIVHQIEVEYDPAEYRRMIESFKSDGTKVYVEATVTIDGTRIEHVGLRLKGNSTLFSLGGRGPGAFRRPGAGVDPAFGPPGEERPFPRRVGGGPGRFGPPGQASAEEPERLPWLISFDHFVAGQRYEGYQTLAVRSGSSSMSTALNEALALQLVSLAGEPAEKAMYTSFAVNGAAPVLRLVVEDPDKPFVEDSFEHDGVLYKSLSTGRFEYRGEDPLAYADMFRQITRRKEHDLKPLIDLLRWTARASDAEFAGKLADHVDVKSFARYVALQNLLLNFDDMAGPGQNYYLWYDLKTRRFTVVTWDLNFAFSGESDQGPFDAGRFGGRGGFGPRGGNLLKERFLTAPAFRSLYLDVYRELAGKLFRSGRAAEELKGLESLIASSGVAEGSTLSVEADQLRTVVTERAQALARSG
jgi:spore coat protein CotH